MRVGMLTLSFLPDVGGMETLVHDLANALESAGHDVTVFAPTLRSGQEVVGAKYELVRFGWTAPGAFRTGINRLNLLTRFWATHRRRPFDVVNIHSAYIATTYGLDLRRMFEIPLVVTCHGHDIQREPSINYGYRLDPRKDKRIRRNLRRADRVVAISESIFDELRQIVSERRIVKVPNGVRIPENVEYGAFRRMFDLGERPVVLAVGRNVEKKGFKVGLLAFREVLKVASDAVFVHAGRGGDDLAALAAELGMAQSVRCLGELARETVWQAYRDADVFVSTATVEGLPLVNLEALASGTACVFTDSPGNRDCLKGSGGATLVDVDDVFGIASAIVGILTDVGAKRRLEQAGRHLVLREYSWRRVAELYMDAFEDAIASAGEGL